MPAEKISADKIRELLDAGYSVERIKNEFGGSKDRIRKIRNENHFFIDPTDSNRIIERPTRPTDPIPDIALLLSQHEKQLLFQASKNGHLSGETRKLLRRISQ